MIEVNVTAQAIEAMKESLKIGEKVTYSTPIYDFLETTTKTSKQLHKARIVKKLQHVAVIEYTAKRGRKTVKAQATMTYREIFFQRRGLIY